MKLGFVGQPYRDWPCAASFLSEAVADPSVRRLLVMTAWVRESGLREIAPSLRELRGRRGSVEFLVGVDLLGTSIQGLELAQSLATSISVVHDPEERTFHPKLYLASGRERSYALVGSNNLTGGGMGFNYEGALSVEFANSEAPEFVKQLELFAKRLREDRAITKRLTPAVKRRLLSEGWLADEEVDRRHRYEDRTRRVKAGGGKSKPLFGKSATEKRDRPAPVRRSSAGQRGKRWPAGTRAKGRGTRSKGGSATAASTPDSWWKQLGPGDAQRPPDGHPTNAVRLTDAPRGEDRATYFRRVFFGAEDWRRHRDDEGNWGEITTIRVEVTIAGRDLGTRELEVDYSKHRDVRGRATTLLRWGELKPEVLAQDLSDYYLLIERGWDTYSLTVMREKPA